MKLKEKSRAKTSFIGITKSSAIEGAPYSHSNTSIHLAMATLSISSSYSLTQNE